MWPPQRLKTNKLCLFTSVSEYTEVSPCNKVAPVLHLDAHYAGWHQHTYHRYARMFLALGTHGQLTDDMEQGTHVVLPVVQHLQAKPLLMTRASLQQCQVVVVQDTAGWKHQ